MFSIGTVCFTVKYLQFIKFIMFYVTLRIGNHYLSKQQWHCGQASVFFEVIISIYNYFKSSINNQLYALNYTTSLFNIQAPTCFGSSLPSSGSFLDPCKLLEMQNK
jgi:hypothetical protein